jgi:hypothetical protein
MLLVVIFLAGMAAVVLWALTAPEACPMCERELPNKTYCEWCGWKA